MEKPGDAHGENLRVDGAVWWMWIAGLAIWLATAGITLVH